MGRHRSIEAEHDAPTETLPQVPAEDDLALELRDVTATFRSGRIGQRRTLRALDALDLSVPRGTVHALLGPNGAGKTTTVRTVATLLRPDSGTVLVDGIDALAKPDDVRERIGVSGQYAAVDGNLTGFENLRLVAQLYGMSRKDATVAARDMLDDLRLSDAADRPVHTYSGGMRRRIDLAGALINRPSLIILDEPTTGLDPRGRRQMWEVIGEQVRTGTTVLLTTQYLEEADALADQITVIDHGKICAEGSPAELKATSGQAILTVQADLSYASGDEAQWVSLVSTTLADIGLGLPHRLDSGEWSVPVADGTRSAVDAVRALESVGVTVRDAQVSAPTLDEVFLRLTGQDQDSAADEDATDTENSPKEHADVR